MEQNKTGKPAFAAGRYLKYVIGEIVVLVITISIASKFNNSNESLPSLEGIKGWVIL